MAKKEPTDWRALPKMSFSSKDLSRRMKKVEGVTVKHARRFVFRRIDNFKEVRRHIALWIILIGVIVGASGLQLMWYQQSYRTTAASNQGTYAEAVLGPLDTLNPIFANSSAEESASNLLFSRLLSYDTTGNLNYDLAEKMTVSKDQKTYTIKMRSDARWTDGLFVRARDVVFTVKLLKDATTRSTIVGWDDIVVKEVDDVTVSFTLPGVYAAFPHALSSLPILPEHVLRDVEPSALRENEFSTNPIGSGPFALRFIQHIDQAAGRSVVHLVRNTEYYKGVPKLDRFQLHVYATGEEIVRAINTGEVNAATDITVTDAEAVNTNRAIVTSRPVDSGVYAIFNTTSTILSDRKVRLALRAGTNTEEIRGLVGDATLKLYLPFLDNQVNENLPTAPKYDTVAANRLLDEAGWKRDGDVRKKDGKTLALSVVTTKNNDFEKVLNGLVEQWRTLGVSITTTIVDPTDPTQSVNQNILQPRRFDVLLHQFSIGADPDVFAYWHSSQITNGRNYANYSSEISDDALVSARSRLEKDLRDAKYTTFARQWLDDVPAIGLYRPTMQYVYTKTVHTMDTSQLLSSPVDRYASVLYWSVGDRFVHQTP